MDTPIYHRGMRLQTPATVAAKTRSEFLAAVLHFYFPVQLIAEYALATMEDPNR